MAFSKFGIILGVTGGLSQYNKRKAERPNESRAKAALSVGLKAAVQTVGYATMPKLLMMGALTSGAASLGQFIATTHMQGASRSRYNPQFGGNFMDTEMTATMRQRGVQAMHNTRMNARSILGNEARSLHKTRPW